MVQQEESLQRKKKIASNMFILFSKARENKQTARILGWRMSGSILFATGFMGNGVHSHLGSFSVPLQCLDSCVG